VKVGKDGPFLFQFCIWLWVFYVGFDVGMVFVMAQKYILFFIISFTVMISGETVIIGPVYYLCLLFCF
jgi:hypothetical protein